MNNINIRKMTPAEEYLAHNQLERKPKQVLGSDRAWNFGVWFIIALFATVVIINVVRYL